MHWSSDVDVDLVVCLLQELLGIHILDRQRSLNAGIVDNAVQVRVFGGDFLDEGRNSFNVTGIEFVEARTADLLAGLLQL